MELDDANRLRVAFAWQPDVRIIASPLSVSESYLRHALIGRWGPAPSADARRALRRVERLLPPGTLERLAPFGRDVSPGQVPVPLPTRAGSATIEHELAYSAPIAAHVLQLDVASAPPAMTGHLQELVHDPEPLTRLLLSAALRVWVGAIRPEWERISSEVDRLRQRLGAVAAELGWLDALAMLHPEFQLDERELIVNMWLSDPVVVAAGPGPLLISPAFGDFRGLTVTPASLLLTVPGLPLLGASPSEARPPVIPPRVRVLAALDRPRTTTDLAAALDRSPGSVSELLSALLRDGLVERERTGRRVLYRASDRGDAIVAAMTGTAG